MSNNLQSGLHAQTISNIIMRPLQSGYFWFVGLRKFFRSG